MAIGRALLAQPRLLLMDEPLASLDPARRDAILPFLAAVRRRLAAPIIYVTHQIDELATLGDTVVLLEAGRVVTLVAHVTSMSTHGNRRLTPPSQAGAILDATILSHDPGRGLSHLNVGAGGRLIVATLDRPVGAPVRLRVPASDVVLAAGTLGQTSAQNQLSATVRALHSGARDALVELQVPGFALVAWLTLDAVRRLSLAPGASVVALLKSSAIQVLDG